ncbi:glycosyltransferase family 4 protein [Patescibacteria group bacterium]
MKIAFLNIYNGVIDRGAETYVKELASRLAGKHQVVVYQAGKPTGKEKYQVKNIQIDWDWSNKTGVGTIRGRFFLDYWSRQVLYFTLKALKDLLKTKHDVVIPLNGGWMPIIIRIVTWLCRSKMIISGQSGMGWDDRVNLLTFPNRFIALSTVAKEWAEKVNPLVKTHYIPNGVDVNIFTSKGKKYIHGLKPPVIVCVSALTPTKRVDLVIKALSKMKNASLLIVGDGDLKDKLNKLGKKLLKDRYKQVKLPFSEMPTIYRSADLFTIASESYYSFEIVLVEAMASGIPVVANNDPIRKDIVGDGGLLIEDPTNSYKYSKLLKTALDKKWGNKPRNQAKKYDWDNIAKEYEILFKDLNI